MDPRTNIRKGMTVMSNDGVQMGYVIDVTTDGIIVQKGALTLKDLRVPFSGISSVRGDEIILVKDHADLGFEGKVRREGTAKATVGVAGVAAPPPQGLGLGPTDLTQARMDSAKFQDHDQYDLRPTGETAEKRPAAPAPEPQHVPQPHEPPMVERRAAGPGWDPLSVDEENSKPPTRY
jgi:hypothetical protein